MWHHTTSDHLLCHTGISNHAGSHTSLFCCRTSAEAQEFKKKFEECADANGELITAPATAASDGTREEADKLAGEVGSKATVADKEESKAEADA